MISFLFVFLCVMDKLSGQSCTGINPGAGNHQLPDEGVALSVRALNPRMGSN